ncbi:archease [archaeon]|nr:archease [archaeon]NHV06736.1 archease [Nitrososphaerota archaeon]
MNKRSFEFLEHTSDIYVKGCGENIIDAIASCIEGMLNLLLSNPEKVELKEEKKFEVRGNDLQELVYLALEQILILVDSEGFLSKSFSGKIVENNGQYLLFGKLKGEKFTLEKHEPKTHIKGITFHELTISSSNSKTCIKVLLDI